MIIGAVIDQKVGMKGLSLLISGILILAIFYGGNFGAILGIVGILAIPLLWFIFGWNKPISSLYVNKLSNNKMNQQSKIYPNLSEGYQDAFKRGLNKKYPQNSVKSELADMIRRNLQAGLKERYGDLEPGPSSK